MTMPKTENITLLPYAERVKLVRERLNGLRYPKTKPLAKPARVLTSEKVVDDWRAKNDEHEDAQRRAHRTKLNEVQDALIVGDIPKAVELLQKLGV